MSDRSFPLRALLDLIPDLVEFDPLRRGLLQASVEDASQEWTGVRTYSTVDRRIVATSLLGSLTVEAESATRRRLKRLYDAANLAFSSIGAPNADALAQQLVSLGEAAESAEQWRDALAYYMLGQSVARRSPDLKLRSLLQRRVGRTALNVGDFARATESYARGLATSSAVNDAAGQINGATGLGNIAAFQGRWTEADDWYANALNLCTPGFERQRGQLLVNRSMAAREREQYARAREFLEEARAQWDSMTADDHAGLVNTAGQLALAEGRLADAEHDFREALRHDPSQFNRAMVLDNLAEVFILRGDLERAEESCREAETYATAHGSPRALAEIYMRLGRVAVRREDANGIMFFEKALDLTRDKQYSLLFGEIHLEYARFRKQLGEAAAAQALFERALEIFGELGATTRVSLVQKEMADTNSTAGARALQ